MMLYGRHAARGSRAAALAESSPAPAPMLVWLASVNQARTESMAEASGVMVTERISRFDVAEKGGKSSLPSIQ